jgi:hypothetical protein
MHTHSTSKTRSDGGGIHATKDNSKVRSVLQNTKKKLHRADHSEQNAWNADISVVLLNNNVFLHIAACTRALMEHFNWELFDHPPYSPDLTPSDCHLFTYLKN